MTVEYPCAQWRDYELIDCGLGEKLERFGPYVLRRPEPKALWDRALSLKDWDSLTHTVFRPGAGFAKAGKEDSGTWDRVRPMDDQWKIAYDNKAGLRFKLRLGLTSFKHVGVFPEQAPNWDWIYARTKAMVEAGRKPKVLNLFAYTGAASLASKAAGADVIHLDSVRQVVTWARQNMEISSLDGIRWLVEDAMKFVRREERRGNRYDGIILDPPAYGHGPDGERWKLDECLRDMLTGVNSILGGEGSFVVLNLYSNGFSATMAETMARCCFENIKSLESGELVLTDRAGRLLPLSVFARLIRG